MADGQASLAVEPRLRAELHGVAPRLLTVDDVLALSAAGAFAEAEKVELIDGRLWVSPSESVGHLAGSGRVGEALAALLKSTGLDRDWWLIPNLTLRVTETRLLQPGWAIIRRGVLETEKRLPIAADLALAVEIADASLRFDEGDKRELYAEAGLAEYWIVRVSAGGVRVCADPRDGVFFADEVKHAGDVIAPLFAPGADVSVADLTGS
jgi:Uma2 family endonuclease